MNKPIKVSNVVYAMLIELAKKSNKKPDVFVEDCIKQSYGKR